MNKQNQIHKTEEQTGGGQRGREWEIQTSSFVTDTKVQHRE